MAVALRGTAVEELELCYRAGRCSHLVIASAHGSGPGLRGRWRRRGLGGGGGGFGLGS